MTGIAISQRIKTSAITAAILLGMMATTAMAALTETCNADICVSEAWARATPPGAQNAAVYFSVVNKGTTTDTLISSSSSVTPTAMVHRSVKTANIVRMEMAGPVELAPGEHLNFAPVGYHLMLEGLKQRLSEGAMLSVTLQFAKAGKLTVPVPVLGITASGPKPPSTVDAEQTPGRNAPEAHAHH